MHAHCQRSTPNQEPHARGACCTHVRPHVASAVSSHHHHYRMCVCRAHTTLQRQVGAVPWRWGACCGSRTCTGPHPDTTKPAPAQPGALQTAGGLQSWLTSAGPSERSVAGQERSRTRAWWRAPFLGQHSSGLSAGNVDDWQTVTAVRAVINNGCDAYGIVHKFRYAGKQRRTHGHCAGRTWRRGHCTSHVIRHVHAVGMCGATTAAVHNGNSPSQKVTAGWHCPSPEVQKGHYGISNCPASVPARRPGGARGSSCPCQHAMHHLHSCYSMRVHIFGWALDVQHSMRPDQPCSPAAAEHAPHTPAMKVPENLELANLCLPQCYHLMVGRHHCTPCKTWCLVACPAHETRSTSAGHGLPVGLYATNAGGGRGTVM